MRKTWGPYCPVPQGSCLFPLYVHVVYPTAWAVIKEHDGTLREATGAELDELARTYVELLARSFRMEPS